MRDVSAIVVTHNSAGQIGACLSALDLDRARAVVVDNASADASVDVATRCAPGATVLANPDNVGFARAVNQGLALVETPFVLLLNPDCTVGPSTVDAMVTYLRANPEASVVGPRIHRDDGTVAVSAHPFESLASVLASRFGGSLVPVRVRRLLSGARRRAAYEACLTVGPPVEVDWLSGACLMVRADMLGRTGGLDERYFLYYEDEELCLQAWRRGGSVVYLPHVSAVHIGGACSPEPGATWPHLYQSMLLFFARHRPATYQAVRVVILARAAVGLSLAAVRWVGRRPSAPGRARAWRRVARVALLSTANREGVA